MDTSNFEISAGSAGPLGVSITNGGLNIAVVSQRASAVWFCLFDADGKTETARLALPGRTGDVFHGWIAGLGENARYGFRADGPYQPEQGNRFDPAMLLVDPYAIELDRPFAYHQELGRSRSDAVDTAALMPKAIVRPALPAAPRPPARPLGLIYELPVKAFTKRHPGIPESLRGTVAALAEPPVIEHLRKIGVDTIELMPIAAWIDERHLAPLALNNAWGYNPVAFLAPDPRLAPGGMGEVARTLETLHAAGFRVILDVVFNHTGEADDRGSTLSLRGLDNALYYRHAADNPGVPINDSGCGNTLALDRPPVMQLALDALKHWTRAGFDGFRFDLAPILGRLPNGFTADAPLMKAIASDPELAGVALIAEPWDVGPGGYQLGRFPAPWAEWNDHYRDGVRKFWRGDEGATGDFATRLAGSSDIFASSGRTPSRSINFVAAHDGMTVADVVTYTGKHNDANGENNRDGTDNNYSWNCGFEGASSDPLIIAARARDIRALMATLLLSRGTPMLTAGDELGRTQSGNNNAYAQDNATTWLDWVGADASLIDMTATLAALRRAHPSLRADRFLVGQPAVPDGIPDGVWLTCEGKSMRPEDWGKPSSNVLGLALMEIDGRGTDRLCLWFNRQASDAKARLPDPQTGKLWEVVFASTGEYPSVDSGKVTLAGRSVVVCSET